MSVTYGFYDSLNGDRKYNSKQFSSLFDGVIRDGVFANVGDAFKVSTEGGNMSVLVGTGRAWFNHTWTFNDSPLRFTIDRNTSNNRIDTIVIDVDVNNRTNDIKLIKGTPAAYPVSPDLINNSSEGHYQYPICDVHVSKDSSVITVDSIVYLVGSSRCPFVSSAMDNNMINALVMRWETEWEHQNAEQQAEFDAFMNDLRTTLNGDQAAALNNKITVLETKTESLSPSAVFNRNTFRGKCLGTTITDSQLTNIRNGSFKDLCIGDYWECDIYGLTRKFRIVDINYWLNTGSGTKCTTNHIVVMPDEPIGAHLYMHNTNADIDYCNSNVRNKLLTDTTVNNTRDIISSWLGTKFNDIVLSHKEYLINSVSNGLPVTGSWYDSTIELPSEIMMYGTRIYSPGNLNQTVPCLYTNSRTQLSLFRLAPQYIQPGNYYFWLRDVVDNTRYAAVSSDGEASWRKVAKETGIRPVFGITGGSVPVEWAIGADLSGCTLKCSDTINADPFYTWGNNHGYGGEDAYLKVGFTNGKNIIIKNGNYTTYYDEVTVFDEVIYREYSDETSYPGGAFNNESSPLPDGSIISFFQFYSGSPDSMNYWDDDTAAMEWLTNNIAIKR